MTHKYYKRIKENIRVNEDIHWHIYLTIMVKYHLHQREFYQFLYLKYKQSKYGKKKKGKGINLKQMLYKTYIKIRIRFIVHMILTKGEHKAAA